MKVRVCVKVQVCEAASMCEGKRMLEYLEAIADLIWV